MKPLSISFFFPAYNEENQIREAIAKADSTAQKHTSTYELIIINDGSKDRTGEIAEELSEKNPRVKVVHHERNLGYGSAVWSGIQSASLDYVFLCDIDMQFDIEEISKLIPFLKEHEIVIGYRSPRMDPFMRLVNAKAWNILNRFFFGLKVKDIDCAFKLMKRELIASLPVQSRGAMISAEILIHLSQKNISLKEVPVTHFPNRKAVTTGANPKVIMRALKEFYSLLRSGVIESSLWQFLKFGVVGSLNTLIDLTTYLLLTRGSVYFMSLPVLAKALSFFCGSIFSFFSNRKWTFQRKDIFHWSELIRFYTGNLTALLINATSTYIFISFFKLWDVVAVIFATIVTFCFNFLLSKFWIFPNKRKVATEEQIPSTIEFHQ